MAWQQSHATGILIPLAAHRRDMSFKTEVIEKLAALITAAFGLVAALAWNGAIQELFKIVFGDQSTLSAMFVYAAVVTIVAIIAVILIGRAAAKAKGEDESETIAG
jgi:cellobiose-specific phosphotransferase system component IIC